MVVDFRLNLVTVNFCLQQWKNYYNRTVFAEVMLKWKKVQFFDSQCRMVWLPDSEKSLKIRLFVLIQCTNVTDTQTDTQTPH